MSNFEYPISEVSSRPWPWPSVRFYHGTIHTAVDSILKYGVRGFVANRSKHAYEQRYKLLWDRVIWHTKRLGLLNKLIPTQWNRLKVRTAETAQGRGGAFASLYYERALAHCFAQFEFDQDIVLTMEDRLPEEDTTGLGGYTAAELIRAYNLMAVVFHFEIPLSILEKQTHLGAKRKRAIGWRLHPCNSEWEVVFRDGLSPKFIQQIDYWDPNISHPNFMEALPAKYNNGKPYHPKEWHEIEPKGKGIYPNRSVLVRGRLERKTLADYWDTYTTCESYYAEKGE